ncbi:hypothetical protein ASZ90_010125 [hydrocarbon metagenome]|uniref:Uncharacterized protein n=1 Tax=hydrocarbon metagenome TaxID=938273 RepID=A0A0W8FGY5_9ZZZZ
MEHEHAFRVGGARRGVVDEDRRTGNGLPGRSVTHPDRKRIAPVEPVLDGPPAVAHIHRLRERVVALPADLHVVYEPGFHGEVRPAPGVRRPRPVVILAADPDQRARDGPDGLRIDQFDGEGLALSFQLHENGGVVPPDEPAPLLVPGLAGDQPEALLCRMGVRKRPFRAGLADVLAVGVERNVPDGAVVFGVDHLDIERGRLRAEAAEERRKQQNKKGAICIHAGIYRVA